MASDRLTVDTADGSFSAYVASPTGTPTGAVIVLQEIFGVNAVMRGITDRFAEQGYLAVCPDLFWRIEPGIDITDQTEAEMAKAFELFGTFDVDKGIEDVGATLKAVRAAYPTIAKTGAVGFCLGGLLAYLTGCRTDADAAVGFYGVGIQDKLGEADGKTTPMLLHIAGQDEFVPAEAQAAIQAHFKSVETVTTALYPDQDHAFARQGGAHFDAQAAKTAMDRTDAFFSVYLNAV
ncbi:MAG: dienelactone hydrolase family protein [Pseudomonadota bacterium]